MTRQEEIETSEGNEGQRSIGCHGNNRKREMAIFEHKRNEACLESPSNKINDQTQAGDTAQG